MIIIIRTLFLSLLALGVVLPNSSAQETLWDLKKNEDGIKVYSKRVKNSPLLAFKAVTEVDYPVSKVATVIKDSKRRSEWVPEILEIKVIEKISLTEQIEYQKVNSPWPLKDREILVYGKILFNDEKKQFEIWVKSTERDDVPVGENCIRAVLMGSSYFIKPIGRNKTRLTVEIHLDPKGMVPKWIVNWVQKGWSFKYMEGFRKQVAKPDIVVEEEVKKKFQELGYE